jgi:hypothetical protein
LSSKRETILLVSVGGGSEIPIFEGDHISITISDNRTAYLWHPIKANGNFVDLTRAKKSKGGNGERHLRHRYFETLNKKGNLSPIASNKFMVVANTNDLKI